MNKGHYWMNLGPNIEPEGHLIVSNSDVEIPIAIVMNPEDIGLIIHAPEMYRILHDLVTTHLLVERVGETDLCKKQLENAWFRAEQLLCDFVPPEQEEPELD
jgi:hypothetical protein